MADEIDEKLLEQVKQQGEIVRKLKAAKANNAQVGAITFTYYRLVYPFCHEFFNVTEQAIPSGNSKFRLHVLELYLSLYLSYNYNCNCNNCL